MGTLTWDLPGAPGPLEALERLRGRPGRVLLQSAGPGGSYSLLAADPIAVIRAQGSETRLLGGEGWGIAGSHPDPFTALERVLLRLRATVPPDGVPFAGGLIGYLGYEAGDHLERLPGPPEDDAGIPDAWLGVYDGGLVWNRRTGECAAAASLLSGRSVDGTRSRLKALAAAVMAESAPGREDPAGTGGPGPPRDSLTSSLSRTEFLAGVERIRSLIRAGDLFQANLTRRISAAVPISGTALYRRMLRESPAGYAAFLDAGEIQLSSISPELFLSVRSGAVRTRPIKGTAPRGATPAEDARLCEALASSEKDRAENVMIVDLLRSDLSRVCRNGSIEVPQLAEVETHPTVHHLVSTVVGELREGIGPAALLRATFPGGSITGAPKIRAMEILRELEPVRRGVYTGALGILGFHGDLDLSVAIRTAVLRAGRVHYGTGGGITLASDPDAEWRETEDKAEAFLRALESG